MNQINFKKFGLAFGITGVFLYIGCALVMLILGQAGTISFFNTLLHGFDVSSIIRMDISLAEELFGLALTFILGWLTGASIAVIYNFSINKK